MSSLYRPLALVAGIALLGGCATMPQPLQGNYANVTSTSVQQGSAGGTRVRWGGEIIKTEPGAQETCFYILARPLDEQARPELGNASEGQGRFVACHSGFYDPEVFTRGREMTVTGTINGTVSKKVGEYSYPYPRVEADVVYLWPKRQAYVGAPYPPGFYDPYWGPWGPWGYGPYWGWGGPRVIVVRPAPPPR
ncbi:MULTISPECIES: Slp family lipoprotein [Rhodanobacter]|uniref:Slp family lipoprotein n=1 Tax=Rhodanobacter hydrolyticus TaxID=2250595 RepID=A0ABW8J2Q8_9GAMM|nr:Slp family lipoprotein [Rhodanobacter sp. 7MK24]MBD8879623.1 Slp family lipoprotein [Rhodanobacter sp. 7MK24]